MSPEQARGKTLDKRADIWAFGCVLYEMLAGSLAFGGETSSDRVARVLTQEPDWQALPAATPGPILVLLRRCLEKNSQRRLRDIGDARLEIETALTEPAQVAVPAGRPQSTLGTGPGWRHATLGLSLLLVALVIAVAVWKTRTSASVRRVPAHLVLSIPPAAPKPDLRASVSRSWPEVADKLFAVATQTRPVFSAGPPDRLFQSRYERGLTLGHINYDVAPDGQHFLMVQGSEHEAAPTQLSVIVNWFEELNRRVPTLQ